MIAPTRRLCLLSLVPLVPTVALFVLPTAWPAVLAADTLAIAVAVADAYTTVFRGTPELLVLLIIYFGSAVTLTWIGKLIDPTTRFVNIPPFWAGALAISLIAASGEVDPPNARVVLISRDGKGRPRRQTRESQAQTTFRGQGANPFLFAVPRDETPVAVEVRWPNGKVARVKIAKAQAKLSVRQ